MPYKINTENLENDLIILAEKYEANKIKNVCLEIENLVNPILQSHDFQNLGIYSQANIASQLKKIILQSFDGNLRTKETDQITEIFKPFQDAKLQRQTARIKAEKETDLPELINETAYLKTALELIKSDDYLTQGLGFMALTGRRSIEIFKTANFSFLNTYEVPNESEKEQFYKAILKNSKNALIFEGQAKKAEIFEKYPITIFANTRTFFASWKRFRNECLVRNFDTKTNTQVQNTVGKALEKRAKKYFSEFWKSGKTVAKDTRLAYSFLSVKQIVSNKKPKGIFYGIENGTAKYLQKNDDNLLNLAYTLLGHSSKNALSSYFLKLNNIKNI